MSSPCYIFPENTWYPWLVGTLQWGMCVLGMFVGLFCLLIYIRSNRFRARKLAMFLCCCLIVNSIDCFVTYPIRWICDENFLDWLDILRSLTSLCLFYSMMSLYILFALRTEIALKGTVFEISRCFKSFLKGVGIFLILLSSITLYVLIFISSETGYKIIIIGLFGLIFYLIYLSMSVILTVCLCRSLYFTVEQNLIRSQYFEAATKEYSNESQVTKYVINLLALKKDACVSKANMSKKSAVIDRSEASIEGTLEIAQIIIKMIACVGISALSTFLSIVALIV